MEFIGARAYKHKLSKLCELNSISFVRNPSNERKMDAEKKWKIWIRLQMESKEHWPKGNCCVGG